jgi:hypothetical protein
MWKIRSDEIARLHSHATHDVEMNTSISGVAKIAANIKWQVVFAFIERIRRSSSSRFKAGAEKVSVKHEQTASSH